MVRPGRKEWKKSELSSTEAAAEPGFRGGLCGILPEKLPENRRRPLRRTKICYFFLPRTPEGEGQWTNNCYFWRGNPIEKRSAIRQNRSIRSGLMKMKQEEII